MSERPKPMVLIILDGWGYSESEPYNAIHTARTPVWDHLWNDYPHTLIHASGAEVGLPGGQMGNSEVGHLNLGAGRVVYQEFTRVSRSIKTGSFFSNKTLTNAVDAARENGGAIHLFGLLSPGGVHSHQEHIYAMAELAVDRGAEQVYMHAFLDGRDTPPKSAAEYIQALDNKFAELGRGRIATLCGRYYAMDRDRRWARVEPAYDLLTQGKAEYHATTAMEGLEAAYAREESDEFVKPTVIGEPVRMNDGDVVIFMNYRSDRAREMTQAFTFDDFDGFARAYRPRLAQYVTLTEYHKDFDLPVAFPTERLNNTLGQYLANLGLRQLRLAETEKYAHVTFFFNGGIDQPNEGEERILIPSPHVATYDLQPEMAAAEVTDKLVEAIESARFDVVICNYANPDMVGHTGNFEATVKALETIDSCLGRVYASLKRAGGELLITADHGNCERMRSEETNQAHTAHTTNRTPLVYVGRPGQLDPQGGVLADIAPTMLHLMGLEQPREMTGRSLVQLETEKSE
ncbi:2,3-bisphosphoglycerate-independent phosphoglycerate mutase [Endothiovibrio diazotrophicus]